MRILALLLTLSSLVFAQRQVLERAWDLIAKGDRAGAMQVLETILKANPANADAHLMIGSLLAEDGKPAEALSHLRAGVKLAPRSADAHYALGEALKNFGELEPARAEFQQAVNLNPNLAPARVDLGLALLEASDFKAAAVHLDKAILLLGRTPDSAYPRYLRAKIHAEHVETQKAAALLQDAVAIQPRFAEAWSDLGEARKAMLDEPGALAAFEESVRIDPENAVAQLRLGGELLRQGRPHEAVQHLQAADRLKPNDQATLNGLQLALRQDGQIDQANVVKQRLTEVLHAIDVESQNAFNALRLNNEGAELEKDGKLSEALEKYRAALALDPTHIGIRVNYAVAALRLGRWADGLAQLREALRRAPGDPKITAALNDALEQAPVEFGGQGRPVPAPKPGRR
ncbi:tetratricopeptide repeat protein [uncultured Paludibaculum sp.]|uniref:tetratricopeptide repeat protein n=1 Tax=uncultured Paludibaculum sp. TaxID=1765020 RepID=UPI002AAC4979|nr:tetratricopeptide repeat protein [uncultured Paludibaculum sp.]